MLNTPYTIIIGTVIIISFMGLVSGIEDTKNPNSTAALKYNPNDTTVWFSPLNQTTLMQGTYVNLSVTVLNDNNVPIIVELQYDKSTMTTTVFVADGLEGWNTTVEPHTISNQSIQLYGVQPGRATVQVYFYLPDPLQNVGYLDTKYKIEVFRVHTLLQKISIVGFAAGFAMTMSSWSCILPPPAIDQYLAYTRLPLIQLFCQFGLKPLVAFALVAIFGLQGPVAYGMIALGCTPGTGPSNMSTYMLGGNYDASTIMTMCSALFAIIAMPFWMYTVGETIALSTYGSSWKLYFPWLALFVMDLIFIIPSILFYIIRRHSEFTGHKISMVLRPAGGLTVIASFIMAIYSDVWLWSFLTSWTFILCALVYILVCYSLGFLAPYLFRVPINSCISLCMEMGLQNVSLAMVTIHGILPSPDGDNAMVVPMMYVLMMFGPVLVGLIVKLVWYITHRNRLGDYILESTCNQSTDDESTKDSNNIVDIHTTYKQISADSSSSLQSSTSLDCSSNSDLFEDRHSIDIERY